MKRRKTVVTSNQNITDQQERSSSSQTYFDMVPQKCVVCAKPQTDGKWNSVHGIVSRWVDVVSVNTTKWWNTLKQLVGNLSTNCLSVFEHFVGLTLKIVKIVKLFAKSNTTKCSLKNFNLWPLFMDRVILPQGCRAITRKQFTFLPVSS